MCFWCWLKLNVFIYLHQDSDDEENEEENDEKPSMRTEFAVRSPSPPAEDSEPEMTEEEREFQLVSMTCHNILAPYIFIINVAQSKSVFFISPVDGHYKNAADRNPPWGH